uniref:Uncharacterized protein n=1 Tax=Magallana gigas TaxID=29159 RepID=A0A8W8KPC1_MAGGI
MDDPAVTRNCYILMYEREDEREKEFTEMDASSNSGKDVEGEDLEDNIDFVQPDYKAVSNSSFNYVSYYVVVDTLKAFGKEVATIVRRFLPRHKIVASRNKALEQKFKPPVYSPSCEE